MKTITVYDPAMCCSTGVCGPEVDPKLAQFAADLKWLEERGATVTRHNLSQSPAAFMENASVKTALMEKGETALPLVFSEDGLLSSGAYPSRDALAAAAGLADPSPTLLTPAVVELIAIGAAVAANCEPCLRYHVKEAEKLGVSGSDLTGTITLAAKVKDAPHQSILRLAARLVPAAAAAESNDCCGGGEAEPSKDRCCGGDDAGSATASRCCG